jgi:N6-L-threonylcarbamoyladenine synthase
MLDAPNLDFSFSGLKTAVRYGIADKKLSEDDIASIAREFEDAVTTVLLKKVRSATEQYGIQTLIVGGGVSANTYIRKSFTSYFLKEYPMLTIYLPPKNLSTDNSIMIALAGHSRKQSAQPCAQLGDITANGNMVLE